MSDLWTYVALRDDYPAGTCWAWMDGAQRVCGQPEVTGEHLCPQHVRMAIRRRDHAAAQTAARLARINATALLRLPARRERLAHVDAEVARLDPPPPTTDMAAYGGLGSTAARRYQRRYTDETIHRLAELHAERVTLVRQVAYAEQLLAGAVAP